MLAPASRRRLHIGADSVTRTLLSMLRCRGVWPDAALAASLDIMEAHPHVRRLLQDFVAATAYVPKVGDSNVEGC